MTDEIKPDTLQKLAGLAKRALEIAARNDVLGADLSSTASGLGARLHRRSAASLVDAVRVMNCYRSNLIEGHNTTPREIEAALQGRLESVPVLIFAEK